MSRKLKGVIIGLRDVIIREGRVKTQLFPEIERLIKFLLEQSITPVVLSNHDWSFTSSSGETPVQPELTKQWGSFPWYVASRDGTPMKPQKAAVEHVLSKHGWDPAEVVYLGNSEADMRTAVNGGVLFLNATWYGNNTTYGFKFGTPLEVARFIDTFCVREHHWHYELKSAAFEYYALAPYGTRYEEFKMYSQDAVAAAKWGGGHPDFWTRYLVATLYFSELYKRFDYVASFPGHKKGSGNTVMEEPLLLFTKCFRKAHLRDLIVRHTDATKSAYARSAGQSIDHRNQLNTIRLRRDPMKPSGNDRYKSSPLGSGKTVLVVDDICTSGFSLETARLFIERTGAKTVLLSWLKTVNRGFEEITARPRFDPFAAQSFPQVPTTQQHEYSLGVRDALAPKELTDKLTKYDAWKWK
jgi:hypothetical protein